MRSLHSIGRNYDNGPMTIAAAQQAMREGRLSDARRHLENLIRLSKTGPEIHYNLAMVQARLGDYAAAAHQFQHCADHAPGNPDILNNLGNSLRLSGHTQKALDVFENAIGLAPYHPALRCNRGWLLLSQGKYEAAEADFRSALDRDSEIEDAWRGLADTLLALNDPGQAQSIVVKAIKKFPDSAGLRNTMGVTCTRNKRPEVALRYFQESVKLNPGNLEALTNLGITAEQVGDFSLAEKSLLQALEVRPGYHVAHFHLAHLATHQTSPEEIDALESALKHTDDEQAKIDLEFSLGKSLGKRGDYQRAFPHFICARQHLAKQQAYDLEESLSRLDASARTGLNLELLSPLRLFVIGMPRSGTTLVDQILAAHPQVVSMGDSGIASSLDRKSGSEGKDDPEALSHWLRQKMPIADGAARVVDTSPGHFTQLGDIATLLPEARFIHCVRNPLDTCVSIFEQPLTRQHAYANTLHGLGRYYTAYTQLMERWQELLGERLLCVRYEKLVEDPKVEILRMLDHCELTFEQSCVDFHRHERAVLTPSAAQVKQPLNDRSVGRWQHYQNFLTPLIETLPQDLLHLP